MRVGLLFSFFIEQCHKEILIGGHDPHTLLTEHRGTVSSGHFRRHIRLGILIQDNHSSVSIRWIQKLLAYLPAS
jgi:hypothetical protein